MHDAFGRYHPAVNLMYFVPVIGLSMASNHPVVQTICLLFGAWYAVQCQRGDAVRFLLRFCLPVLLLAAVLNAFLSHRGATALFYLPSGNPVTLESTLYGLSAGTMIASAALWFMNFQRVLTADRFLYLFGRAAPALSLVLTMTLRFLPRFKAQLACVREAQRGIGADEKRLSDRMRNAVSVFSVLITWSLESAADTADSMKSRGYGSGKRTSYSAYTLEKRDKAALLFLSCGSLFLIAGAYFSPFSYFPRLSRVSFSPVCLLFYAVYAAICAVPILINIQEERKWKSTDSAM